MLTFLGPNEFSWTCSFFLAFEGIEEVVEMTRGAFDEAPVVVNHTKVGGVCLRIASTRSGRGEIPCWSTL